MSPVQYPTTIVTMEGTGMIFEGHGLDHSHVLAVLQHDLDPFATDVMTEQVWLHLYPRIKNCADYGGPCELEGEWHGHWAGVKPSPGAEFTIAYPWTITGGQ